MTTPSGAARPTPRTRGPRPPRRQARGLLALALLAFTLPVDASAQGPPQAAPVALPVPGDVDTERSRV